MERMSNVEIQMYLQQIGLATRILMGIPTDELLREFSLNDTLGPLLDPTGWIKIHENASKNERVVRAVATYNATVLKEWPEIEQILEALEPKVGYSE